MYVYDTIVVGGGPSGLTVATYSPGTTCLIDLESSLGGCHRASRVDGRFVEHGPRVYHDRYVNTKNVLCDIGTSWDDIFVKAQFSPHFIDGKPWYRHLSARESLVLSIEYLIMALFDRDRGRNETVEEFSKKHGFEKSSIEYLDLVCRFSDGAGADRYSMWEFMSGFDQHTAGSFYEPRVPHDVGLFAIWESHLASKGTVVMMKNERVVRISSESVMLASGKEIRGKRVVCAIPPKPLVALLRASGVRDSRIEKFAIETDYNEYMSVAYHFDEPLNIPKSKGLEKTPWGIVWMEMSKYTTYSESRGVVSAAATILDVPSPATGKTALRSSPAEIRTEIWRQIGIAAMPSKAISNPGHDEAFVFVPRTGGYLPHALPGFPNAFTVGCHTGHSSYNFTSMEGAVENALHFVGRRTVSSVADLNILMKTGVLFLFLTSAYFFST